MAKVRQSYSLNAVAEHLHNSVEITQEQIERGLALIVSSLADDGRIDEREASQITLAISRASVSNAAVLSVSSALDVSGIDAALTVVTAQQVRQRKVVSS